MKQSPTGLVAALEADGLAFSSFELVNEGAYEARDVDWNQRDLLHVRQVHGSFDVVPAYARADASGSLFMQRVLGFSMPLATVHYESAPGHHVYFTTLVAWVLIIESHFAETRPGSTRVTTTFRIGTRPWLRFTLPLVRWLITRNHARLDREDLVPRLRRADLRAHGFRFRQDSEGSSYAASLDLERDNVIAPEAEILTERLPLGESREYPIGNDRSGVRVVVSADTVLVFPRTCPHDGACLDGVTLESARLRCPWHGRVHHALARLDLRSDGERCVREPGLELHVEGDELVVRIGLPLS